MMKTFAQILNGKAHWIFTAEETPEFAPDIQIIDITGASPVPAEGWGYDGSAFTPPAGPSADDVRARRDALVGACDWIVQRQRDQVDAGGALTLTTVEYAAWTTYRQALRDLPKQPGFPGSVTWPAPPATA